MRVICAASIFSVSIFMHAYVMITCAVCTFQATNPQSNTFNEMWAQCISK